MPRHYTFSFPKFRDVPRTHDEQRKQSVVVLKQASCVLDTMSNRDACSTLECATALMDLIAEAEKLLRGMDTYTIDKAKILCMTELERYESKGNK